MSKKTTSLAKTEANRRNALKSTGPRSPAGKRRSRWNALKHGLLSQAVVIEAGDGKEDRREYESLVTDLASELKPEGMIEQMLVGRLATCYWRLRRVLRCEVGEIRKGLDSVVLDRLTERVTDFEWARSGVLGPSASGLQRSSLGLRHLLDVLDRARTSTEETGRVPEDVQAELVEHFGTAEHGIAHICLAFSRMAATADSDPTAEQEARGVACPDACKELLLDTIGKEKTRLERLKSLVEEQERLQLGALMASLALPDDASSDKIMRYERSMERQFYRALGGLLELQRNRRRLHADTEG